MVATNKKKQMICIIIISSDNVEGYFLPRPMMMIARKTKDKGTVSTAQPQEGIALPGCRCYGHAATTATDAL